MIENKIEELEENIKTLANNMEIIRKILEYKFSNDINELLKQGIEKDGNAKRTKAKIKEE